MQVVVYKNIPKKNAKFDTFNANSIFMAHLKKMQSVSSKKSLSHQQYFKAELVYESLGGRFRSKLLSSFSSVLGLYQDNLE